MSQFISFSKFKRILQTGKPLRITFMALSVLMFFLMILMSGDAGISGDEYFHVDHAKKVYNFYKTFGKDSSALFDEEALLHLYGQSLDNLVHIFNEWFDIQDIYRSRHLFNSIVGWILILFTGLTSVLLMGWRAGIITLLLMFFSPKILGHSWNNLKDLPFAAAYMFSIFFLLKFIKELPKIKSLSLIFLALGIGWAISLRIGGLIMIPYAFLFVTVNQLFHRNSYTQSGIKFNLRLLTAILATSVTGYFMGLILWPYALLNPVSSTIETLKSMTNYNMGIYQLFEGTLQESKDLPWYYGLKYIFITTPVIISLGLLIAIVTFPFSNMKKKNVLFYAFLFFAFAFPIAYTLYNGSNLYGGWRHLLWTYAPITVISTAGFDYFINKKNKYIRYGTVLLMAGILIHPVRHTFKNHPHQYIYYNQIVGGIDNAYGKYEMDYYYHSLKEASTWIIENKLSTDSITIVTNHPQSVEYYFRNHPNVKIVYSRFYKKSSVLWDYSIWANTHITPSQIKNGLWPPKQTIHTINVDNSPVAAITQRVSYEDLKGFDALRKNNIKLAKKHFKTFLILYPENEQILEEYSRICWMERKIDSTIYYADLSLDCNPRQIGALLLKANVFNYKKEHMEAIEICNEIINLKESSSKAHYQKGFALSHLNNYEEALEEFQIAIGYDPKYYEAYIQFGNILSINKRYNDAINVYSKVLKFLKNDINAKASIAKCYHFLNQNDKAEKLLMEIPMQGHNHFEVVKLKSRIALQNGNLNRAGQLLISARKIQGNSDLSVIRGLFFLKSNRIDLAIKHINKAIELDQSNKEAQELLKSLTKSPNKAQLLPNKQQTIMLQQTMPLKTKE